MWHSENSRENLLTLIGRCRGDARVNNSRAGNDECKSRDVARIFASAIYNLPNKTFVFCIHIGSDVPGIAFCYIVNAKVGSRREWRDIDANEILKIKILNIFFVARATSLNINN